LSPRSYHVTQRTMDDVIRILVGEIGGKFDPAVVAALINHLENKGARSACAHLGFPPADVAPRIIDPPCRTPSLNL
jgi:HD-GYP domain-containing protein (c-di-GMP phosphodiesterase class II)